MNCLTLKKLCVCVTMALASPVWAQGTASSPTTTHIATLAGDIYAGGPNDLVNGPGPFPIDLDPAGGPWTKLVISDPAGGVFGLGSGNVYETIQNVGTEPWHDWHEKIFSGALGVGWNTMVSVMINGSPITYNQTISGGILSIDTFSQPVLPGDVLELHKTVFSTQNVVGPGTLLFSIEQYPTPEPATLAMLAIGTSTALSRRRMRSRH